MVSSCQLIVEAWFILLRAICPGIIDGHLWVEQEPKVRMGASSKVERRVAFLKRPLQEASSLPDFFIHFALLSWFILYCQRSIVITHKESFSVFSIALSASIPFCSYSHSVYLLPPDPPTRSPGQYVTLTEDHARVGEWAWAFLGCKFPYLL